MYVNTARLSTTLTRQMSATQYRGQRPSAKDQNAAR